jgi:uncharacterized membrane protein
MDDELPPVGETYAYAWDVLRERFPELLLAALAWIAFAVVSVVLHSGSQRLTAFLWDTLVMVPLNFGALGIYLRAARGESFEIGDLFAAFRGRWATVLGTHVIFVVLVGVGCAFFVVPGIWIASRLSFVAFLVMDEHETAMGAVRESWDRTEGHSWRIVRLWLVGLSLSVAGAVLLGVGVVPAAVWAHLAFAALYVRVTAAERGPRAEVVHSPA